MFVETSIWTNLRKLESALFLHNQQVYILGKIGEGPHFGLLFPNRRICVALCSAFFDAFVEEEEAREIHEWAVAMDGYENVYNIIYYVETVQM